MPKLSAIFQLMHAFLTKQFDLKPSTWEWTTFVERAMVHARMQAESNRAHFVIPVFFDLLYSGKLDDLGYGEMSPGPTKELMMTGLLKFREIYPYEFQVMCSRLGIIDDWTSIQ